MIMAFALAAALLYGSADFLGGAASRRAHVSASVLLVSAPAGMVVMLAAALLAGGPPQARGWPGGSPRARPAAWADHLLRGPGGGPDDAWSPRSPRWSPPCCRSRAALAMGERPGRPSTPVRRWPASSRSCWSAPAAAGACAGVSGWAGGRRRPGVAAGRPRSGRPGHRPARGHGAEAVAVYADRIGDLVRDVLLFIRNGADPARSGRWPWPGSRER